VAIAAVIAVLVLPRDEPRIGAVPAGPTSRSSESSLPATRAVPVAPIRSWGNAAMLVAQRLVPYTNAVVACRADRAPYVLHLEIRVNSKLLGDIGVAGAVRATVIGSRTLTTAEICVDRVLTGVVLPALPAQLSAARISLVISPAASPTITVPAVTPRRDQTDGQAVAERLWADPVAYVLGILGSEFTPKPSNGDTALACISKGRRKLEPPRGTGDLVFIAERRLRYVVPDDPTALDRCLERHAYLAEIVELPSGVDQLELAFARPKSAR
jgi:hypothetical protein